MSELKSDLRTYLIKNGKTMSYTKLYDKFPFKGNLTQKQKSDTVRSIWKSIKKENIRTITKSLLIKPTKNQYLLDESCIDKEVEGFISNIPSSDELDLIENYESMNIKEDGIYLVLGCVHAPFVNLPFWKAMLKMAKENKDNIKGLILAGDFLDLHSLSSYDRGKLAIKGINLGMEYKESIKYLKSILNVLHDNIYKGWLDGNHENRMNKYMAEIDNSKLGNALPSPEVAMKLDKLGFEVFNNWKEDEIQLGNLSVIHGEICTIYPCKKYIDTFKRNFLFFHTHRTSMHREGEYVAYNAGSMADFSSPVFNYATKAMKQTWTNSFAVATLYKNNTTVDIPVWNKDYFTFGGKIYK